MSRHPFNFDGGEYLTTIGASWFVSYMYYCQQDKNHLNWKKVATYSSRIGTFNQSSTYHKFWLQQVLNMDDSRLNTNRIGLNADQVKQMAKILLNL